MTTIIHENSKIVLSQLRLRSLLFFRFVGRSTSSSTLCLISLISKWPTSSLSLSMITYFPLTIINEDETLDKIKPSELFRGFYPVILYTCSGVTTVSSASLSESCSSKSFSRFFCLCRCPRNTTTIVISTSKAGRSHAHNPNILCENIVSIILLASFLYRHCYEAISSSLSALSICFSSIASSSLNSKIRSCRLFTLFVYLISTINANSKSKRCRIQHL